jgi:TrmH family RNA methyltransferase
MVHYINIQLLSNKQAHMKLITSLSNPYVKKVVELKEKKGREQHKQFVAEGLRTIQTCLESSCECEQLMVSQKAYEQLPENIIKKFPITVVSFDVMKRISSSTMPSGFLGIFAMPKSRALAHLRPGIALHNITDPGNMGTLIRTAVALNACCVIVDGCDRFNPKVVQASAGLITHAECIEASWERLLMHKKDLKLCALVVEGGSQPREVDLGNSLLVVGSEAHGLPDDVIAACDTRMTLPMAGPAESLNAAVAGSIALYLQYQSRTSL